jgi:hypothetical protein
MLIANAQTFEKVDVNSILPTAKQRVTTLALHAESTSKYDIT